MDSDFSLEHEKVLCGTSELKDKLVAELFFLTVSDMKSLRLIFSIAPLGESIRTWFSVEPSEVSQTFYKRYHQEPKRSSYEDKPRTHIWLCLAPYL